MDPGDRLQRIRGMGIWPAATDRDRASPRYPVVIAAALGLLIAVGGCGDTTETRQAPEPTVGVTLPAGWHEIRGPINDVIEPAQVLAASSVPLRLPRRSAHGCSAAGLRRQLPADAAAVQVVESTKGPGDAPHPNLHNYRPRPRPFRLEHRSFANYGCSGPSYNIAFRDHGRAFQAFVWLDPKRVDPRVRRQTIALLNSLRVSRSPHRG
jgi:hypothetical protein